MRMLRRFARALAPPLIVLSAVSCSLVVDTSELDAGCPTGERLCEGMCVSDTDPAYGCDPTACGPPCTKTNGIPHCVDGVCELKVCRYGFGCEACDRDVLTDEFHCGACRVRCPAGHRCVHGKCEEGPTITRAPVD